MLRTRLCTLLGIDVPIICAPFGPWEQVELAAAVCRAGGLGSLGTGAVGVNIGTRFLASTEMSIPGTWKQAIVDADPLQTTKVRFAESVLPPLSPGGVPATPRVLRTAFVERWNGDPAEAARHAERLREELRVAAVQGRLHELLPFTGQSAALVHDIAPASELVHRIVGDAEQALRAACAYITD